MKKFFGICIFLFFIGLKCYANNSYSDGVKQFLYLIENNQSAKASEYLSTRFTEQDWKSYQNLIEKNSEKVPSFYIITVADYVYKTDKDKAVEYYYRGMLRAKEDVLMCVDTTARQQFNIWPRVAPKTVRYVSERVFEQNDKAYLANALQKALDWDKSHSKRYDPSWACYHGINVFIENGKPKLVSKKEQKEIIEKERTSVENAIRELKLENTKSK